MASILDNDLHWATLTQVVDNRPRKVGALSELLFSRSVTLPTEHIEIDTLEGDRAMAPFVKKNGEALYVGGLSTQRHLVEAPNIRIKRGFHASELMSTRRPGTGIFPERGAMASARQRYIADELDYMVTQIEHREEWMASQALRGSISYSDEIGDSWQITFPRLASHDTTAGAAWADGTDMRATFMDVSETMAESQGASPDIVILGSNARDAFMSNTQVMNDLDRLNFNVGSFDIQKYRGMGMLRLGRFMDIEVWTYPRTLPADGGGTYDLIRPDYAEFIHLGEASDNVAYYAAIADMDANATGIFEGRRFSKSWYTEDPSSYTVLTASRPLFVPRKPNAFFSLDTSQ